MASQREEAAAEGFEGMDLGGFGAFPMISLKNDGNFETHDGVVIGTEFYAVVLGTKEKFVYSNGLATSDVDYKVVFSPDREYTTKGEPIPAILSEWQSKGWTPKMKKYLDILAQYKTSDVSSPLYDQMVLLSVPPASTPKFWAMYLGVKNSGRQMNSILVHVHKGQKVTSGKFPFTPWGFKEYRG